MVTTNGLITRKALSILICIVFLLSSFVAIACADPKNVLVVSVTKGFRHGAIPLGEQKIKEWGDKTGDWKVDYAQTDEDLAQKMTAAALKNYDAVIFNNTSGDLPLPEPQAFLDWIKAGGGFVGIHAATDCFKVTDESPGWPEYIEMIGGQFIGHGPQATVEAIVEDRTHPATLDFPNSFVIHEEIYLFKSFSRERVRGLITQDKHPNTKEPGDYPLAWVRDYGEGRVFYTALGHRDDIWESELFQRHLTGGIRWTLGLVPGDATPVSPPSPVTEEEKKDGFRALFNAKDLTGWKPRVADRTPWTAQNGMLVMGHGGSDLISEEKFEDFIIRYEYMVPEGGNSGVYLRGRYEVQVLDDYASKQPTVHANGAIYAKIAPSQFASKPPGEWQTGEAKLIGNRVTVILNGIKIIDDQPIDGPTGGALDDKVDEPGPIMLQGDHGPVAYRNIRIKPLN